MPILPLPFSTFGSIADAGWRMRVYCAACYRWHPVEVTAALRPRLAFHARFRCARIRPITGTVCASLGHLHIDPADATKRRRRTQQCSLGCAFALPPWTIEGIVLDEAPWPRITNQDRYRCPGCRGALGLDFYGGPQTPDIAFIDHASARR